MIADPTPNLRQLLAFYVDAGVDCALDDAPANRMSDDAASGGALTVADVTPERGIAVKQALQPAAPAPTPGAAPDAAIVSARAAAASAPTLQVLRELMQGFDGCALRSTATQLVFADGNPQARVMFVGEAPGRDEDIEGLPFVGRSGKLLDRMLAAIGLGRGDVYIANVIPWRPPGNRTPTPQETEVCLPFIRRHVELVDPDLLVTLGNPSTQALLGTREGITRTRGRWFDYDTGTRVIRALPTLHPAYLLRQPIYKRLAWQDLRTIATALAALPPRG